MYLSGDTNVPGSNSVMAALSREPRRSKPLRGHSVRQSARPGPDLRLRAMGYNVAAPWLQNRLMLTARMPERKHMQRIAFGFVVNEVADATQKQASYTRRSCAFILGTKARLLSEQRY